MKVYNDFENPIKGASVTFGFFDGVHLGHRAVLDTLVKYENPLVISFYDNNSPCIYTQEEKAYAMKGYDIDAIYSMDASFFDNKCIKCFIKKILIEKFDAKKVIVGGNYKDLYAVKEECAKHNIEVIVVPITKADGKEITTDRIKEIFEKGSYEDGSFDEANKLMGHPYILIGPVVHGKAAGRKVGMPTANLGTAKNKMFAPYGVYGTLVRIDGKIYRGMTNIGLRPSDDDIPIPTVETLILDFDSDIYDKIITLDTYVYIRGVKKFANLQEVKNQVDKDIAQIKEYMDEVLEHIY